jgi:hypothetical protein
MMYQANFKKCQKKINKLLAKCFPSDSLTPHTPPSSFGERLQSHLGNEVALAFLAKYCLANTPYRLIKWALQEQLHFCQAIDVPNHVLNNFKKTGRKFSFNSSCFSHFQQDFGEVFYESIFLVAGRVFS